MAWNPHMPVRYAATAGGGKAVAVILLARLARWLRG